MGLPNINIAFKTAASTLITRSTRGVVAVIIHDDAALASQSWALTSAADIPAALSADNKAYVAQAFIGNDEAPKKVLLYVLATTAANLSDATAWLATQQFDWLCGPADADATDTAELKTWILAQRANGRFYKAVLPDTTADSAYIVNFTTDGIAVAGESCDAPGFCARIAGLLAGTSLQRSATFSELPEVTDVTALSKSAMDTAVDAGQFIIFHDGYKVKAGRGVTSLTTTAETPAVYKKIRIVEICDKIRADIRLIAEDDYIGKYSNSYDNKLLLVTALKNYFETLEIQGLLRSGGSSVDIDIGAVNTWLISQGTDTSDMTDQEIREADTNDQVFLTATIEILDAIEDITLTIVI